MVNPERLLACYCGIIKVSKERLIEENRVDRFVLLRQIFAWIAHNEFNIGKSDIARVLGRRDHTTIISSIRKIEQHILYYETLNTEVRTLSKKLHNEFINITSLEDAPATIRANREDYHLVIEKRDDFWAVGYIDKDRKPLFIAKNADLTAAIQELGQLFEYQIKAA